MESDLLVRLASIDTLADREQFLLEISLDRLSSIVREAVIAAAIPHWFDRDYILALLDDETRAAFIARDSLIQLLQLSFVEVFPGRGYGIHEHTRELLLNRLWREDRVRFRELSHRAASYCVRQDQRDAGWRIETIYHRLMAGDVSALIALEGQSALWDRQLDYGKAEGLMRTVLEATDRGHMLAAINRYLQTMAWPADFDEFAQNPWRLLVDMPLAASIVNEIVPQIGDISTDGLCILCDSGIPIGVLLAQAICKPMYFFRRRRWAVDAGSPPLILPEPDQVSSLSLVDSHVTTGFSSRYCYEYLSGIGIQVDSVITLHNLQQVEKLPYRIPANYISLSEHYTGPLASAALSSESPPSRVESRRRRTVGGRLANIVRSLSRSGPEISVQYVDRELLDELHSLFDSTDVGIWRYFAKPALVERSCKSAGGAMGIGDFDVVAGIGPLGAVFAVCLAWHNSFEGAVVSTSDRWIDTTRYLRTTGRCLAVCSRLRTGIYIKEAVDLLAQRGINVDTILVLRYAPESSPRARRTLSQLRRLNLGIFAVS